MRRVYWIVWAVAGAILEGVALFNGVPNDTLTGAVVTHIPGWLLFSGVGWAGWHFMNSYMNGKDER